MLRSPPTLVVRRRRCEQICKGLFLLFVDADSQLPLFRCHGHRSCPPRLLPFAGNGRPFFWWDTTIEAIVRERTTEELGVHRHRRTRGIEA